MVMELAKIKNNIPGSVREYAAEHCIGRCQFVSYLEKYKDEVLQRVFAYKQPKGKDLLITEVLRRLSGSKKYIMKNLYFVMLGGYQAIFTATKKPYFIDESDFDVWFDMEDNYFKVGYDIINPELLLETKYKYCNFNGQEYLMDYLNTYIDYPNLELLSKLGIRPSKTLLKKAMKDKQFCKYLSQNKEDINRYGSVATLMAYKNQISVKEAYDNLNVSKEIGANIPEIRDTKIDRVRLFQYLKGNNISFRLYDDYLKAIKYLNMNLEDTKNIYPREFMRMHDLRIQEYDAALIKDDLKKKRALNSKFKKVANEYSILNLNGRYLVVIAKDIKELLSEGNILHHCVGKMGYDKKMADRKSLILFIRQKENPSMPYVTMEYSLEKRKILQIYGDHDSKPSEDVLDFVNNKWLKYAKKQLKLVAS